jgi:hypothetical protein
LSGFCFSYSVPVGPIHFAGQRLSNGSLNSAFRYRDRIASYILVGEAKKNGSSQEAKIRGRLPAALRKRVHALFQGDDNRIIPIAFKRRLPVEGGGIAARIGIAESDARRGATVGNCQAGDLPNIGGTHLRCICRKTSVTFKPYRSYWSTAM